MKRSATGWFQTFTGRQFWPTDPRPEDFDLRDIATGLSQICRFNGHTNAFYSVAQHSVLVSRIVPPELAWEGLMHDAAEAYIGDVIRPLKHALPDYRAIETRLEEVLAERFGLKYPWPPEIKEADNVLLMTERRDLVNHCGRDWSNRAEPMEQKISPWSPGASRWAFIDRARDLGYDMEVSHGG